MLSKIQQNYIERKAERRKLVVACIRKHPKGISQADIALKLEINRKYIADVLKDLKAEQKIHIHEWMASGGVTYALWVYGRGLDADKKIVRASAHSGKKAKERQNLEDAENIADVARKRHEMWAKNWRPHLDPAAAWLVNPI